MVTQLLSLSSARRAGFSSKLSDHRTVRPSEPTMQTTTIIHHGRIGLLSFFCLSVDSRRRIFFHYRSMPWIDSTKKIRRKTASGNSCFAIYRAKHKDFPVFSPPWRRKRRISFDLGGIFAYHLFEDVLQIFEKAGKK
jgi:hypothetical protein